MLIMKKPFQPAFVHETDPKWYLDGPREATHKEQKEFKS